MGENQKMKLLYLVTGIAHATPLSRTRRGSTSDEDSDYDDRDEDLVDDPPRREENDELGNDGSVFVQFEIGNKGTEDESEQAPQETNQVEQTSNQKKQVSNQKEQTTNQTEQTANQTEQTSNQAPQETNQVQCGFRKLYETE